MKKFILLALLILSAFVKCLAQPEQNDVVHMESLISQNLSEYDKQTNARSIQAVNTGLKTVNRNQHDTVNRLVTELHTRLTQLDMLNTNALLIGEMVEILLDIANVQEQIIKFGQQNPEFLPIVILNESKFIGDAVNLSKFVYFIFIPGELNEMSSTDRVKLIKLTITKFQKVLQLCNSLKYKLQLAALSLKTNGTSIFSNFQNNDANSLLNIKLHYKF